MQIIKFGKYIKIIFSGIVIFSLLNSCSGETFETAINDYNDASHKPLISSLTASNNTTLSLSFDVNLDENSAKNARYSIIDKNGTPLPISSIQATEKSVTLTTDSQQNQNYTVKVTGIKSANTIEMESYSGNFSGDALPEIVNITTSSNDRAIFSGTEILILVEFSEPVDVTGIPSLLMNTGINSNAIYISGSGTNILTFSYIVNSGDSSSNLDVTSLSLNGGSIKDFNKNVNPNLSVPTPGEIGSLSYNNPLEVNSDYVPPTLTSVSITSDNADTARAKVGETVTISFTADEAIQTPIVTIDGNLATIGGTDPNYTASYTLQTGDTEGVLTFTIDFTDLVGNTGTQVTAVTDGSSVTFDETPPTFAGVSSATAVNSDKIDLGWSTATDNISSDANIRYEICQDTASGNCDTFTATYTTSLGATSYNVIGLTAEITYYFVVRAVDQSGNQDTNTNERSATTTTVRGPFIQSAEYYDTDQNGRLDHVKLTFDETLDDSTFDGFISSGTPNNQVHNVTTVWDIAGRVNIKMDTRDTINTITGDNVTDDNVIWLAFDEIGSGYYDTGASPDLTANDSNLQDLDTGYCFIQTDNANCSTLISADIITSDVTETDLAPPIIVNASGITSSDVLTVTFSEPVDSTLGGGCSDTLVQADFQYNDVSGGDIDGIDTETNWTDTDGCDDNIIKIRITDGGTLTNLSANDINLDTIQPAAASIYDAADNIALTNAKTITGAIAPYVLNVVSTSTTTIRITFSEPVDNAQAMNYANYTLVEDPDDGVCPDIIFDDPGTPIVKISESEYELANTPDQCATTTYKLTALPNIIDQNEGIALTSPDFGNFLGAECLRIVSAACTDTTNIQVIFNKDVLASGAEDAAHYKLTGADNLGAISSAVLSPGNVSTLTHTSLQTGGIYMVVGSNGIDGDGFDDSVIGAIRDSGDSENLQASPNDRASFTGCGTEITNFSDGPISSDPFGDRDGFTTDFSFVTSYNNKIFVGPNKYGNGVSRFEPAGTNPVNVDFSFTPDIDITINRISTNSAGPPFYSIGHTACTANSNDKDTGCGPDNEDGRGFFASGIISGTEYLFITGTKSTGDNDYLYWTTDTDTTLNFNYIDLSDAFDNAELFSISNNKGTESIAIMNDNIYWMFPGSITYRPFFIKINTLTAESSTTDLDSQYMLFRYMTGIGDDSSSKPNWADKIGGTLFVFNDRLYVANSGSVTDDPPNCDVGDIYSAGICEQTGGIIRSTNNDPDPCTADDNCDFIDITPTAASEFVGYFSILLPQLADLTPAIRPIPAFAGFNGNLYMIRNACTANMIDRTVNADPSNQDDVDCTTAGGTAVPQLWKCVPDTSGGAPTTCESGDWSIVADDNTSGYTNMSDGNNTKITLLITNGSYLYVGFDNSNGIEIYRTKAGITNPSIENDFEQIGTDGLGDTTNNLEIYSATSVQDGVDYYIYVSTGKSGAPVSVYRQKNN